MTDEISVEDVAKRRFFKRNKSLSCWMIIHDNVYDVTSFLKEHPGGEECLISYAGKNATDAFEKKGHSDEAREMLKKYKIGELPCLQRNRRPNVRCSQPSTSEWVCHHGKRKPIDEKHKSSSEPPVSSSFGYWWVIALLVVLGGAFVAKQKMSQ